MDFKTWADEQLGKAMPDGIIAFCFNLYDAEENNEYDVQLVGCREYDPWDDDWACDEAFSSGEEVYTFTAKDRRQAQKSFARMLGDYLAAPHPTLTGKKLAYGFVDDELVNLSEEGEA